MNGLMMPFQLTLGALVHRCEQLFRDRTLYSETPTEGPCTPTYGAVLDRSRRLAASLEKLGLEHGDRVATLCWNHYRHMECYIALTAGGYVLHTLNLRLHGDDLTYIANHADDRAIIVDEELWPLFESFKDRINCKIVIVNRKKNGAMPLPHGCHDYQQLVSDEAARDYCYPEMHEDAAAALCYTSGTTGRPKGVLYSHRALVLHTMAFAMKDVADVGESDVLFPIVPMFHANCWGIPFVGLMTGARLILTGPHFDLHHILDLLVKERVTFAAGVPTIWLGMLQELDKAPGKHDLSHLQKVLVGGSAAPIGLIQGMQERHRIKIVQLWGMTEMSPLGTMCHLPMTLVNEPEEVRYSYRIRQGTPLPFVEVRAMAEGKSTPWDGKSVGELEVRGPWVAREYFQSPEGASSFTTDGWFRTGDIVTIDKTGCIAIQDRAKDLIKSGGEWISSVALENALMSHPCVAEAAVVAVAHDKWQERPLACVVRKQGNTVTQPELLQYLAGQFAKWWLPDAIVFVDSIPRTGAGKFLKKKLRDDYRDYYGATSHGAK